MIFIKVFVILPFVIYGTCKWVEREATDNSTDHAGFCYSNRIGVGAMEKGEYKTLHTDCILAMCDIDGTIYYHGCNRRVLPASCFLEIEKDSTKKPYPDCCPYVNCTMYYVRDIKTEDNL